MVTDPTRAPLRRLLQKLDGGDGRLPLAELVELTGAADVDLTIDRDGDPTVVFARPRRDRRFDDLSARELEVVALLAAGRSNRQIATELYIAEATVKDHVHAVLGKSGCVSRAEVAAAWHGSART